MKITVALSEESIKSAIKQLNSYKRSLNKKVLKLIDAMVAYGEDYAINEVGHVDTGDTLNTIRGYRNGNKGVIVAGGSAVFLEFGTGVRYNGPAGSSPHPKGNELDMTIGEYPDDYYVEHGVSRGASKHGWYYENGAGEYVHTYGIPAKMFMWKTARELERVAPELAKEIFRT